LWIDPKGWYEDYEFFTTYLRSGDVVVDVGANIGTLSLCASRSVGVSGKVYSIEPHPRTFSYLKHNLEINRIHNVTAYNCAAGNSSGIIHLSDKMADDENTVIHDETGLIVPVHTLDELFSLEKHIHLLKLDVEGYEKFVLEGASEMLSRTELIYFEAWKQHFSRFDYCFADVWQILNIHGFETFRFITAKHITTISKDYQPLHCENLIAMRDVDDFKRRTNFHIDR